MRGPPLAAIYLENGINSGVFHYRGDLDASSEPAAYARQMGNQGLRVIVTDGAELGSVGAIVEAQGLRLRTLGPLNVDIQDVKQRLEVTV